MSFKYVDEVTDLTTPDVSDASRSLLTRLVERF